MEEKKKNIGVVSILQACVLTGSVLLAHPVAAGQTKEAAKKEAPADHHAISPQRAEEIDACVVRFIDKGLWTVACHVGAVSGQAPENQFLYPFNETRVGLADKGKGENGSNFYRYEPERFVEDLALYGQSAAEVLKAIDPQSAHQLRQAAVHVASLWEKNDHQIPASVETAVFHLARNPKIAASLSSISNAALGRDIAQTSGGRINKDTSEALAHQFGRSALVLARAQDGMPMASLQIKGRSGFFAHMLRRLGRPGGENVRSFLRWYGHRLHADLHCARESFGRHLQASGEKPLHPLKRQAQAHGTGSDVFAQALSQALQDDKALHFH